MLNWSTIDRVYRKLLLTKFFTQGWGKADTLKRIFEFGTILSDRSKCQLLVSRDYPIHIDKDQIVSHYRIIEGHFESPLKKYLPDLMPKEVQTARFEAIFPVKWPSDVKPVTIHLAGTGDHFFWRRRMFIAKPLVKEYGIGSILLENPFYGSRKPKDQLRSSLRNVSDLFVMGGALMLESVALLHWCERHGFGPLVMTGVSMGGHMASLAATAWHKPIGLVPCLSWSSATPVFTRGAMSGAISWDVLRNQYDRQVEYQAEIMKQLLICPKTDAFRLGRSFAKNFPETFENLQCVDFDIARVNKSREDSKQVAAEKSVSELDCDQEIDDGSLQKQPAEQLNGSELKQLLREGIKKKLLPANYSHMEKDKILDNVFYQKENELERSAKAQAREENQKNTRVSQSAVIGCGPGCSCYTSSCPVGENNSGTSTPRPTPNHKVRSKWGKTKHSHIDLDQEAYNFMRGVMDVCTFIGNFDVPVDTDLIISVLAKEDAYIPRDNILGLNEIWPGTEIRYIDGGHIYAALFQQHLFRKAIHDVIEKYKRKYPSNTKVKRNDR